MKKVRKNFWPLTSPHSQLPSAFVGPHGYDAHPPPPPPPLPPKRTRKPITFNLFVGDNQKSIKSKQKLALPPRRGEQEPQPGPSSSNPSIPSLKSSEKSTPRKGSTKQLSRQSSGNEPIDSDFDIIQEHSDFDVPTSSYSGDDSDK